MPLATKTLLTSMGLLMIGHGIQLSLLPLYANHLGWDSGIISLTGASYFGGFMCASLLAPKLLSTAGHIRVFLSFSALLAIVILCLGLFQDVSLWIGLRFLTGMSIVGVYLAAESWLSTSSEPKNRGKTLSYYALVSLIGIGIGQTLIGLASLETLFQICAIIMLSSLIPVGLFCTEEPEKPEYVRPSIMDVREMPIFLVFAIVLSAVVTGSLWSVAPLYGLERGLDPWEISMMMNALVFGAAVFQVPLGILSDKYDRKTIYTSVALMCLVVTCVLPFTDNKVAFFTLCFIFGGLSLTQYALTVALANEQSTLSKVKVASIILMLNGGGSIVGPLLVAFVSTFAQNALLIVCAASMFLLLGLSIACKQTIRNAIVLRLPRGRHPKDFPAGIGDMAA